MGRGSIIKRCPICHGKKKTPGHHCSPQDVSYFAVYRLAKKQRWEYAGRTRKEAELLLERRVAQVRSGALGLRKRMLFSAFVELWLENVPKPRVKASTFRGYLTDVRLHLVPFFGHQMMDEIQQEHIESFLSQLMDKKGRGRNRSDKKLDPKTVNNVRLTLRMVMDYARRLKYITENPVVDVRPFKVEKKEMDYLSPEELRLLFQNSREPFKTLFITAAMTGMRRSELAALQWGDIEWVLSTIFVRRSIYFYLKKDVLEGEKRWRFISPKSKRAVRALVMSPILKKVLQIHRTDSPDSPFDLVFCNKDGNPLDTDHMYTREFLPTLTRAGIRRIRFHDLRHTYTTLLIEQGESLKFIQASLGHASIQTTMDVYGHLLPVNNPEVGAKMDRLVFGASPSNNGLTSHDSGPTLGKNCIEAEVVPSLV